MVRIRTCRFIVVRDHNTQLHKSETWQSGKTNIKNAPFTVNVSPIPIYDHLNISITNATNTRTEIEIRDIIGNTKIKRKYEVNNSNFTIQEKCLNHNLTQGVYIIQIKNNQDVYTQKIIAQ
jgi:hypothetical protein